MHPKLLTLILDTPLDNLLDLPQAVQIAYAAREALSAYTHRQLQQLLVSINGMIEAAVQDQRTKADGEIITRQDERDLEWLGDAICYEHLLVPAGMAKVDERDYYRVLALYKLGCAFSDAWQENRIVLTESAVAALMEAQEAWLMAELLPKRRPLSEEIAEAWYRGLRPDPDVSDEIRQARSQAAQHAADVRHANNRQAKQRALVLYFEHEYPTIEDAAATIARQVFRATGTVRNWIFEARRARGMTTE